MIDVQIIADSVTPLYHRVTTYILKYPRYIHADFMTHRLFSRNASSSRARPVDKVIEEAEKEYVSPSFWGKNQRGMQSFEELGNLDKMMAQDYWNVARLNAIQAAKLLNGVGMHKQYVNRILEPFTHITVICTATHFGNFFNLRAHKDAMPEIQDLAFKMLEAYELSVPAFKNPGEWHIPFGDKFVDTQKLSLENLLKISTARAARVSYLNYDGKIEYNKDYKLHDDLAANGHWSPFEHAACALDSSEWSGNFQGWKQYRKMFNNEHRQSYSSAALFAERGKS